MKPDQERFEELWPDFLEGELDEDGMDELRHLLAEDETLLKLATDTFQEHRLLGVLAASENSSEAFIRETVDRLPQATEGFVGGVMDRLIPFPSASRQKRNGGIGVSQLALRYGGWAVAALLMALLFFWQPFYQSGSLRESRVKFTSLAKASFFGELTPPIASKTELNRNYSLVSGSVELTFPSGAETIIEGPAIFRIVSNDRLALDVGQCSVHAPKGAEGFRVDTPSSKVIDRGTRFHVSVSELSETEVQVVEGAADIYPAIADGSREQLIKGDARRIGSGGAVPTKFSNDAYRMGLPDRIVSYEATTDETNRAVELSAVTIQRGGSEKRYEARHLIPVELVTFNASNDPGPYSHLIGGLELPERRASLLEDLALNTGVINPGGSIEPLTGEFDPATTPGFCVRFRQPVRNGPGPDVVLFEIQNASYPPEGDAFHVSPLAWGDGNRRTHTILRYDLMLTSSEILPVAGFHHFVTKDERISSLAELESAEGSTSKPILSFDALATGVDLSDLGFAEGETVTELFFQDALDDRNLFDPVLIAGLPE
ncbi:MAG: FecR domain-containing protein [Verrucomicrobiae bacterium]|nr:FecR domain-containing protein [Verrucomicrobiae bacterium]